MVLKIQMVRLFFLTRFLHVLNFRLQNYSN